MVRQERLEPEAAPCLDRLGQPPRQLERPLGRAEVREVERRVGEDERRDGDGRLLGQPERHRRADEDAGLARLERRPRGRGRVWRDSRVVANDPRLRKGLARLRFEPLRAPAEKLEPPAAAATAQTRRRHATPAEPALERPRLSMIEERQAAAPAAPHHPALRAGQGPRVAEPVEHEQNGSPAGDRRARRVAEPRREARRRRFVGAEGHALHDWPYAARARVPRERAAREPPPSSRGWERGSRGGSRRLPGGHARGRGRARASGARRETCGPDPPRRPRPPGRAASAAATRPSVSRPPGAPTHRGTAHHAAQRARGVAALVTSAPARPAAPRAARPTPAPARSPARGRGRARRRRGVSRCAARCASPPLARRS